jgi:ABC-type phosphate transport system substrate-binding protein
MKKLFLVVLLVVSASLFPVRALAQVIVIANPDVKADSVSKAELREVYTGESTSIKEAGHVVPVLLKEGPAHVKFVTDYVGESPTGLILCWRGLVLSGHATMPKTVDSEAEMVAYVAKTPGAIGYIGSGTPHEGVKVLSVH